MRESVQDLIADLVELAPGHGRVNGKGVGDRLIGWVMGEAKEGGGGDSKLCGVSRILGDETFIQVF